MAKKSKKKMNGGLIALLAIVCLVIGLFGGAAATGALASTGTIKVMANHHHGV